MKSLHFRQFESHKRCTTHFMFSDHFHFFQTLKEAIKAAEHLKCKLEEEYKNNQTQVKENLINASRCCWLSYSSFS